jgi:gliding motility-associated-like protein
LNAGNNPTYQWTVNGKPAGTNPVFNSSTLSTKDTVQCLLVAFGSCALPGGTGSNKITIHSYPLPSFTVQPNNPIISKGDSVQLVTTGTYMDTFRWSPGIAIDDVKSANPFVWPPASQVYLLTVTSDKGCSATKEIPVGVISAIHVPNAFSPNHDGVNDNWVIKGLELYPHCTVTVLDRWGHRICYSARYAKPWNGTFNNQSLPVSSFVYIIDLKNGTKPMSGVVTIVR